MSVIVIGNGLVANSLTQLTSRRDTVLFASGVSNSSETSFTSFERERVALESALQRYHLHRFFYFSSTIVSMPAVSTPYSAHKQSMERILLDTGPNHLIIRLPQLVGPTKSPTLVAFLRAKILAGSTMTLQTRARRRLLCHYDLRRFVALFLHMESLPSVITLAPKFSVSPVEIARYIADFYGINDFRANYVNIGYSDSSDISFIESICSPSERLFFRDYWKTVLFRNLPLL